MFGKQLSAGVEVREESVRVALVSNGPVPSVVRCAEVPIPPGSWSRLGNIILDTLEQMEVSARAAGRQQLGVNSAS